MTLPSAGGGSPRRMRATTLAALVLMQLGTIAPSCTTAPMLAFPGAEGFGAYAAGGRGGSVIEVTNLDDIDPATGLAVPGSLRAAIEATGRRTVVFRVSGTIEVCEQNVKLAVYSPYLTIAGQTAPGDGITLRLHPSCDGSALTVWQHDVVIRHLRIRPGANSDVDLGGSDAISVFGVDAHDVIVDHCSLSWATDENVDVAGGAYDVTVQHSIVSEGLKDAPRAAGGDSGGYGMLIAEGNANAHTHDISVHRNLFAHNWYRNPQVGVDGRVDYRNNVIYDWGLHGLRILDVDGPTQINVIGNFAKSGPSTSPTSSTREVWALHAIARTPFAYFVAGNLGPRRPNATLPELDVVFCRAHDPDVPNSGTDCDPASYSVSAPWPAGPIGVTDPVDAYDEVLQQAGATRPRRDTVDSRVVAEVQNGTGGMVSDPSEVGGWPVMASGAAPADGDHDGMPDAWEIQYGLDPGNGSDGQLDADGDRYRNLEEYLNSTDPRIAESP